MVEPIEYNYEEQASQQQSDMMMPGWEQSKPIEAALIEKLDPSGTLTNIKHLLKGERYDEEIKQWKQIYKPLCPDECVNKLMINAASIVNQNTTLSDLDPKEISTQIYFLAKRINRFLRLNADKYKIDYTDLDTISESIVDMAFNATKRGKNRGEMKALRTVIRSQESLQIAPEKSQKKKKAIFGGG